MPIEPSTAFVSYSREDLEFVLRLAKDLKAKGAKVWMDKLDIRPGQRWEAEIEAAVDACSRMLVVLSPPAIASKNVLAEASLAIDEGKEVIPVLYRECKIPFRLRPLQYSDFRSEYEAGMEELLATLSHKEEVAASEGPEYVRQGQKRKQDGTTQTAVKTSLVQRATVRRLAALSVLFLLVGISAEELVTYFVGPNPFWFYLIYASAAGLITGAIYRFILFGRLPVARSHSFLLAGSWALGWIVMAHSGLDPLAGALGGVFVVLLVVPRRRG